MSACMECGGAVSLTRNPDSRFFAILWVDSDTGERHVCRPYRHAFDGMPTSEPCSGTDTCPDCLDVARQTAEAFQA